MNVQLLIDAIVRQTTVLVAQLATTGGARAPLASVANQVFLDLAEELNAQGVSRKVSADMFGLALRTYLRKIQRLRESSTDSGRSLWEAVLEYLGGTGAVSRTDVLRRFHRDDAELVLGILHDLSESGFVFRVGAGPSMAYRAATKEDLDSLASSRDGDGTDELIWAIVYREGPVSLGDIEKRVRRGDVVKPLSRLVSAGRIHESAVGNEKLYSSSRFFVPVDATVGWEAAVFDHFQAVVASICARLRGDHRGGATSGGSTYTFDVWPGHPHEAEVLGLLADLRRRASELRTRVRSHNEAHERPRQRQHVTFYGGQSVVTEEEESEI